MVEDSRLTASDLDEDSPKKKFKPPEKIDSLQRSDAESGNSFKIPQYDGSPEPTPKSARNFRHLSLTPAKEERESQPVFKRIDFDGMDDVFDISTTDPDRTLPTPSGIIENKMVEASPETQKQAFKTYGFDDSLVEEAQALVQDSKDDLSVSARTSIKDDTFATMTQRARCPMCNALVDPAEIRAYGNMNIRMQEKFCRAHRKKTAEKDWEEKGYPAINWEKLDSRISKHHALIKKLINGEDSYYRELMEDKVNAGKDRSLMKMTSNLTPGYYGTRGLRAISENIMHKFTPLLKKRIVEDKLMSARGFTPYVQSVLVPEVASRLIMEDLSVTLEKARDVLTESVEVGELLNDEIRDVVKRRIEDSEDEDEDDE